MTALTKRAKNFFFLFLPLPNYYGKEFKQAYAFLRESRHWSKERLLQYKLERLKALVQHAEKNVPYYRELFRKQGITSADIKTLDDYARLPILPREIVRTRPEEFMADNIKIYGALPAETSGTTGAISKFLRSNRQEAFRNAVIWRFYHECGYKFRDRRVSIGRPLTFDANSPVSAYSRMENDLAIDTYHIFIRQFDKVIDAIRDFRPRLLWSQPNVTLILAEYMVENGIPPIEIPLVATYSEKLNSFSRKTIQTAFPGRYIEYYGNRENNISAWGNSDDKFYENSEVCHFEVENRGSVVGIPEAGDLIATNLHNYSMPLIRYNTDDIIRPLGYADKNMPYPVIELIGGRGKDMLMTHEGLTISYFHTYLHKNNFTKIKRYQLEQISLDEVIVRLVLDQTYDREREEPFLQDLTEKALNGKFKVRLEYKTELDFTKAGKCPAIISKFALDYFDKKERISQP